MPRNFSVRALALSAGSMDWRDPRNLVRGLLGGLLILNLIAAGFALHLFGRSADEVAADLAATRLSVMQKQNLLNRTRQIVAKVELARGEGDHFLTTYMTPRRTTYSTVAGELQRSVETAGLTWKEGTIAPLEPVKGSADLSMMTITAGFEGSYANLTKFVNLLDRSPRFLIIDQLAATPQPGGKTLSFTLKVVTFVRDEGEAVVGGGA